MLKPPSPQLNVWISAERMGTVGSAGELPSDEWRSGRTSDLSDLLALASRLACVSGVRFSDCRGSAGSIISVDVVGG